MTGPETIAGRYRLERLLGKGGMGEVHLARDLLLNRPVAIKFPTITEDDDPSTLDRFRREALASAALDHPFVCKVHEVGEDNGRAYLVMEYLEGQTLDFHLRQGLLPPRQAVEFMFELAQALDVAHKGGVVHRDLKPANVMVSTHGHLKVLDFGLAKTVRTERVIDQDATETVVMTDRGTRLGTPAYMSPEQAVGGDLDSRSDVFSLGTIYYQMMTGAHPFQRPTTSTTMAAILRDPPGGGTRDLDTIPGLADIVFRMLAKEAADRYQSVSDLLIDLEPIRERSWGTLSSLSRPASAIEPPERTPLVARESELAELVKVLERMLSGHGGLVLLSGESGVGKTRLARELHRLGRGRGCLVLTGQCFEQQGAPPYGPFVEIMDQAVRQSPREVRVALGESAPEIATIMPGLRRSYSDIAPSEDVPAEQQRRLLFPAYVDYTRRLSLRLATVMLIDDLHWADESTLQLLLELAPHLASMRVLVVATCRDKGVERERPFYRTVEALIRLPPVVRVNLRRLTSPGVEQMLAALGGSPPPAALVRVVFEETDGNAFFVEEVYQHLCEEGRLLDADGKWKAGLRADQIQVPESVRLVITRRVQRLGETARRVLTTAGVIGRVFPIDLLVAVVDLPEEEVIDAIEETERAHLVMAEGGRSTNYRFSHELVRSTLVSELSVPRRQRLHLRVADNLERLRATALDAQSAALAHHLYQAGGAADPSRTTFYLTAAAQRAYHAGAFEEVLELVDQLVKLDADTAAPAAPEIEELRAKALMGLGRPVEAIPPLTRAFERFKEQDDDAGIARVTLALAFSQFWRARVDQGVSVLTDGHMALSAGARPERCQLQAELATALVSLEQFDQASALYGEAVTAAEQIADPHTLGVVLTARTNGLRSTHRLADVILTGQRALAVLDRTQSWQRAETARNLALSYAYTGQFAELDAVLHEIERTAGRVGHFGALWVASRARAAADLAATGNIEAFRQQTEADLQGPAQWRFVSQLPLGVATFYLGDVDAARTVLNAAAAEQPARSSWQGVAEANLLATWAYTGDAETAHRAFLRVAPMLARDDSRNLAGRWFALMAAVPALRLMDEPGHAAALYPATLALIETGQVHDMVTIGPNTPRLSAALAAEAAGLVGAATGHFEVALQLAERLSHRLLQPAVKYWYGRMLVGPASADGAARGRALLEQSAKEFRELKMPIHAGLADRALS
jgi:serine/threonine protein kinase/tetratricopeptide (TPR) repeat protein